MIIAKFGGTSVSTAARIHTLCDIINRERAKSPIVVVSAVAGVTNLLLSLPTSTQPQRERGLREIRKIHKILVEDLFKDEKTRQVLTAYIEEQIEQIKSVLRKDDGSRENLDKIASFGEIMSSQIVAVALETYGIPAKQVLATDLIVTNNNFGSADFIPSPTKSKIRKKLLRLVKQHIVPVITGFIGQTKDGRTTTLGRGGSDYTASIIGFCLGAGEIQIWTDVDGVYSADPGMVKEAKLIPVISFKEASELATFGARVLHPRAIKPAIKDGIPVRVLNTFNLISSGTLIVEKPNLAHPVISICAKRNITLVNIYSAEMLLAKGFLAKIFQIFAKYNISIDLVGVSEVNVSVTLDNDDHLQAAITDLSKFAQVTSRKNLAIVSIIGEGIVTSTQTITDIFEALHTKNILVKMVSLGATDINLSLVIENAHVEKAVSILHDTIVK